jgi:soluble lytic murein transglycosylase-like protein
MLPVPGPKDLARIRRARAAGIVNPLVAWQEARRAGVPYPLVCAVLDQETGGGHNVWGHDPTIFVGGYDRNNDKHWGSVVTMTSYRAYKTQRGTTRMQGVGPLQLTWWSTQDKADSYGGCWVPRFNIRVGVETLAYNVRRYGMTLGVKAYNGSGPAADRYAREVAIKLAKWQRVCR